MESFLHLLERSEDQQWVVWSIEDGKLYFAKAFAKEEEAKALSEKLTSAGRNSIVSPSDKGTPIKFSLESTPDQIPEDKGTMESLIEMWICAVSLHKKISPEEKSLKSLKRRIDRHFNKHPDHEDEFLKKVPKEMVPEVLSLYDLLFPPEEEIVCTPDSCSKRN